MKTKYTASTEPKSLDQETKTQRKGIIERITGSNYDKDEVIKVCIRSLGSLFIILSALILFADKITTFDLANNYGFADSNTYIWMVSVTASPILALIGFCLNPFKISFIVPAYFLSIQMYWVHNPGIKIDDVYLQVYAFGCVVALIITVAFIHWMFNKAQYERNKKIYELQRTLDLDLAPIVRRLIREIAINIKKKFVPVELHKEYSLNTINLLKEIEDTSL